MSKRIMQAHWLPIWLTIYATFLTLDIIIPDSPLASALKYLGIFLCLLYVYRTRRRDTLLLLALTFTFLADTILIWTHQFVFGIFIFTFAHYFHITRFTRTTPRFLTYYYLIVVSVFLFVLLLGFSPIYAIASTYALSLLANLLLSARWYRQEPRNPHARSALAGFILFSLCDICVAIQFLSTEGIFSAALLPLVTYLVWLFYYPSQILISNSSTQPATQTS